MFLLVHCTCVSIVLLSPCITCSDNTTVSGSPGYLEQDVAQKEIENVCIAIAA